MPLLYGKGRELTPVRVKLRAYFMWADRGPSAMAVWVAESAQALGPAPLAGVKGESSFAGHGEGVAAMSDRVLPESSADESIPRLTFWPHKGGEGAKEEWLKYRFDSDGGERRRLLVRRYRAWRVPRAEAVRRGVRHGRSVDAAWRNGVAKDAMNTLKFASVTTTGLRLRVELADRFSAGVLEWEVGGER